MQTRTIALAAAAVAIAGIGGMALAPFLQGGDAFADCAGGAVGGSLGGPFELVDGSGRTVTDRDVLAEPALLYFGFASCPDVCPLDMARNAAVVDLLAEEGIAARPVFVTVDPERDGPEVVGDYATLFHPNAIGLTGSAEQVDAAAKAFRVYYAKVGDDPETYVMDHSAFTYLTLPGLGFVDVANRDEAPEAIAGRMACFVEAAGA